MQHTSVATERNVVGVMCPVLICMLGFNHKLRHEYYCDYTVSESNAKSKREIKTASHMNAKIPCYFRSSDTWRVYYFYCTCQNTEMISFLFAKLSRLHFEGAAAIRFPLYEK